LAGAALIPLGAGAAYFATMTATRGLAVTRGDINYLALGVVAVLTAVMLIVTRRGMSRSIGAVGRQLQSMLDSRQIGLVMSEAGDDLPRVVGPLNALLTATKTRLDALDAANRDLQIQSRVAEAEKHHTEAIIFSISDAVVVTNRFDELVLANQAAEDLLGFSLERGIRRNIDGVLGDETLVRLIREARSHGRGGMRKTVEHQMDHGGVARTFNVTLSCVLTPAGEASGVVVVLHDITREKEISRMKTDFVSNVSHELKTPLASIKAYVEMLVDGEAEDAATQREFYEIIASETDRLGRLIDNILNISRIESGVVKVVREPMSLTVVVKEALDVAAPQARLKHIEISEALAPVYHQVEADRDMIYQAVLNLLSNAIKYTPQGRSVKVSVSVDERRQVAVCQVSDTGVGIPPDELPHIFDKFYRVRANSKEGKGTGLGLTLTKHIIETVHDGKLFVTSEPGKGSTFAFELPVAA
jgi:two-component system phosphate regulon sensor histidine kinase PhoR